MRIGSLFSGIGGLEKGLEWAGIGHTVWQVERDPYCQQVLARHWPDATRYDDITTLDPTLPEKVDVICGGYPCQPYSTSGRRKGHEDHRDLWPYMANLILYQRPRYVVIENVPGHLSLGFDRTLRDLAFLGYDAEWSLISACTVGAPHVRERLFCIAYPAGQRQQEPGECWENAGHIPAAVQGKTDRLVDAVRRGALPFLCREDHGLPARVERVTALGNAVVPQVAWLVGMKLRAIVDSARR